MRRMNNKIVWNFKTNKEDYKAFNKFKKKILKAFSNILDLDMFNPYGYHSTQKYIQIEITTNISNIEKNTMYYIIYNIIKHYFKDSNCITVGLITNGNNHISGN